MRTRAAVLIASLALLLAHGACGGRRPDRVVIGIGMTPIYQAGVRLAAQEVNAAGGIGGVPVELAGIDWSNEIDPFNAPEVLERASRFNATPGLVAVIGHADSASTLSAAASYNRDGIPQLVTIATNPAITNIGEWTYRLCLSDAAQGPALATYAVNGWGKRRLAILYVNDDYGRGLAHLFEERARALGAVVVGSVAHRNGLQADDEATIREAVNEWTREKPDLVVLFQRMAAAHWTLRLLREAGMTADVLGGDNLAQYSLFAGDRTLAQGMRVSQFLHLDMADSRTAAFVENFRKATGADPDYGHAYGYDAVYLLRDAVQGGGYSRAGVRRYLDELIENRSPIRGVTGVFTLAPDHDARRPLYIAEARDGRFQLLQTLRVE